MDKSREESLIANELARLADLDPERVKEYARFQYRIGVWTGYIVSTVFTLVGLGMLLFGPIPVALMGLLFTGVGILSFVNAKRYAAMDAKPIDWRELRAREIERIRRAARRQP